MAEESAIRPEGADTNQTKLDAARPLIEGNLVVQDIAERLDIPAENARALVIASLKSNRGKT